MDSLLVTQLATGNYYSQHSLADQHVNVGLADVRASSSVKKPL